MGDTTAIPEPPQVYDFSRLLPEIPKFEPRKISKPKTHQTTQSLSGNKLIRTWKSDIKRKTKRRNCTWRRHQKDISFTPQKIPTILDDRIFEKEQEKKREREEDKQIKSETDLQKLKDELDACEVPKEFEFYFGVLNKKFFYACQNLDLNEDNTSFIDFLSSDIGSQIFRENYFWDDTDHKTVDKYDFFTNKNVKHLFYRFNYFLLFRRQPILMVRHSKKNCPWNCDRGSTKQRLTILRWIFNSACGKR